MKEHNFLKLSLFLFLFGVLAYAGNRAKTSIDEETALTESFERTEDLRADVIEELSKDAAGFDIDIDVDFDKLHGINTDIMAWLYVPDTYLSFPVLKERTLLEYYYLDHDYTGAKQWAGSVFTPAEPTGVEDAHLLLFGHHTRREEIAFSNLYELYSMKEEGLKHHYAYLLYPDRTERYELWCAVESTSEDAVYEIPYQAGSDSYEKLLEEIKGKASYINGNMPGNEDQTLVLSTCNGAAGGKERFYVVFRKEGVEIQ